jgi:hypothetical protein
MALTQSARMYDIASLKCSQVGSGFQRSPKSW